MYVRKKKRNIKRIVKITILLIFIFIFAMVIVCQNNIKVMLIKASEARTRTVTAEAINDAVLVTLLQEVKYEDLVFIDKNNEGEIVSISANSKKINSLSREITKISSGYLKEAMSQGIDLPLGSFTGIEILSGFGSKVNFKLVSISDVKCKFISRFLTVGVNQTRHSIYLNIVANVSIIMPNEDLTFSSINEVLLCESIIVGDVPDTYLQTEEWTDASDFLS